MVLMRQVAGLAQVIKVLLVLSHDVCAQAVVCTPEGASMRVIRNGLSGRRPWGEALALVCAPEGASMRLTRSALSGRRPWAAALAPALSVPLAIAACSSNSASGKSSTKPISGGTATFALPAGGRPNSILPLNTITVYTNTNIFDFQYLMYRPLYWFGMNGKVKVNPSLSIADLPVFSK